MPVLVAELKKIFTGKMWWVLLVIALLWIGYISYSFGVLELESGAPIDSAGLTATVSRQWFQMHLFTSLLAALAVTREFADRTAARSVLVSGRTGWFWQKTFAATLVGIGYALVSVIMAIVSAWVFVSILGETPEWSPELSATLIGVFACAVLATPFGAFLGWIIRNSVVTMLVLLVFTLLIEPMLLRVNSDWFNWMFSLSLQSIYLDPNEGLLEAPVAYAVASAWLVVLGALGYLLVRRRDVR